MKTSNIKTSYSPEDVQQFLEAKEHANPASIEQLTEGHVSQAVGYETVDGDKQVFRIAPRDNDFKADQYAFDHYGDQLPVPKVLEIGEFEGGSYYCVTERARGVISDALSSDEITNVLPAIHDVFAKLFKIDVTDTTGFGPMGITTGNAHSETWEDHLLSKIDGEDDAAYKQYAHNIGLDETIVDGFLAQFRKYLPFASDVRRLLHGDLGFDNLLLDGDEVTAVIDWAHVGYGDWMSDFAKFDFWWPDRFGSPQEFAERSGLDADHIDERIGLYWAFTALETIRFADQFKSDGIASWLREHAKEKLLD